MGGDLSELNFDDITYYVKPSEQAERSWDEVPEEIKRTFDKLGNSLKLNKIFSWCFCSI